MNRKIEKQYIRKVRQSLPVYGCKERAYIKKLEEYLQDYCDEYPDVAEEDIVKVAVVERHQGTGNHVRISIFVITASIIILNIFCGYFYYKEYQATRNSNITKEETITVIKEER